MDRITVFPITRIEAEAKLVLEADEGGMVVRAHFYPYMAVRGFEYMLVGKNVEFLPTAVMRICGVCHVTHAIASVEAAENLLGITVPEDGLILREICGLANRLQSHAMHMLFIQRDIFESDKEKTEIIFRMLKVASEIMKICGHASVHPSNICVGGVRQNVSEKGREEAEGYAKEYLRLMSDFRDDLTARIEYLRDEGVLPENLGNVNLPLLATHPYYGDPNALDLIDVSVIQPIKYYADQSVVNEAGSMIAFYRNDIVEVGPRARMKTFFNYSSSLPLAVNLAYAEDAIKGCERIIELIGELNIHGKTREFAKPRAGTGIGVHEAPRGTNIHILTMRDDGIITRYRIIVPTMFNIPVIDRALVGAPRKLAELIVRSYDPCLSCATH